MTHYYSEKQDSVLRLHDIEISVRGANFSIRGASGVFSAKKLDKGTELLLNCMQIPDSGRVLDLGCGYGVVGITVRKLFPQAEVVMSDVNKRAVKVAKMNAKDLGVDVIHSDKFEKIEGKFDVILLNPPQTAGKDVCFDMIDGAKDYLNEKGSLQIVARHQKGGRHLSEKMEQVFGNVEVLGKKGGFRVYKSFKL